MRPRLIVSALAVSVAAAVATAAVPAAPADALSADLTPCAEAAAWVTANADALPTNYTEFSEFSGLYRQHIYSASPTALRVEFWLEHIDRVLLEEDMTVEQRRFIEWARTRVEEVVSSPETPDVSDLAAISNVVLGRSLARRAFYDLGSPKLGSLSAIVVESEACSCHKNDTDESFSDAAVDEFAAEFEGDCPNGYQCRTDGDGCDLIEDQCGFMDTKLCDGECLSIN